MIHVAKQHDKQMRLFAIPYSQMTSLKKVTIKPPTARPYHHLRHRPIIFLDIETTGGSARSSRITEIGALRVENGEVVRTFSKLINPEQSIPSYITRLTGISNSMVQNAPIFNEISDELTEFMEGSIFAAHYVQFDYGFIKQEYNRMGKQFAMDRLCSVRLSRRLYPAQPRHGLDSVIRRLGVKVHNRHRAFDDAEVLYKMFAYEYARDQLKLFRNIEKLLEKTPKSAISHGEFG